MIQNETTIASSSLSIKLIRLCLILPSSLFFMSCQSVPEDNQPSLMEQQLIELIAIQNAAKKNALAKADIETPPAEVLQALK